VTLTSRQARSLLAAGLVLGGVPVSADTDLDALAPYANRRITAIELQGHRVTKESVIRREIRTAVGEPLRVDAVAADVQRLDNLSIFAEIGASAAADGDGVRLTFRLKEMPAWIPWVGFSYTEQDGFSGGPKVSALNLGGRAISLGARAYFGGAKQYSTRLVWPWISGNHLSLEVYGARLSRTDTLNDFKETSYEFTPEVGTYLGEHGRLEGKFSLFRMESDVHGKTLSPDNSDVLPRLGVSLGWDTRDSWRFPRRGWQNELELWRTGLGGDGDFWSVNVDLRRWFPVGKRQRVLVSSLASFQSGTVGEDIPVYLLYRMGGANSIRGYSIDDLGRTLFGKNQLIGTVEYSMNLLPLRRWDIWKFALRMGLDLAVFTDIGIAWSESSELAADRARGGVGAGLRLLVPGAEMVRFDVGWSRDGGFHFHFASGSKPAAQRLRIR
jgi:outer membrane protein insertion porin family